MDDIIGDIIGFLIAFIAVLTLVGSSLRRQRKIVTVPHAPLEVEKRIPTGRRVKPQEHHDEHAQALQPSPAPLKPEKKITPAQKMQIKKMVLHYEILSRPKAFRNKV